MNTVIDAELLTISAKRDSMYSFLRLVFSGPLSMETLKYWKFELAPEFIEVISEDNENLQNFFAKLKNGEIEDIYQEEKEAYLATFDIFNKEGRTPAPPWESVYVTHDHALFGEPVLHIRKKLHDFGLKFIKENKEPEDHISIELEFMSFLINYTADAFRTSRQSDYEKGLYTQYWLLKEHLNKWINLFAGAIQSSAATPFYKGMAELLSSFVAEDFEYIKSLKEDLENE